MQATLKCLQIAEPRRPPKVVLTATFLAIQVCGAVTVSFVGISVNLFHMQVCICASMAWDLSVTYFYHLSASWIQVECYFIIQTHILTYLDSQSSIA